jgi:hypothetical protein
MHPPHLPQVGHLKVAGRSSPPDLVAISFATSKATFGSVAHVGLPAIRVQASATRSVRQRWRVGSGVRKEVRRDARLARARFARAPLKKSEAELRKAPGDADVLVEKKL